MAEFAPAAAASSVSSSAVVCADDKITLIQKSPSRRGWSIPSQFLSKNAPERLTSLCLAARLAKRNLNLGMPQVLPIILVGMLVHHNGRCSMPAVPTPERRSLAWPALRPLPRRPSSAPAAAFGARSPCKGKTPRGHNNDDNDNHNISTYPSGSTPCNKTKTRATLVKLLAARALPIETRVTGLGVWDKKYKTRVGGGGVGE